MTPTAMSRPEGTTGSAVRVVCYHVNGLRGDRAAMDEMLRDLAPDLVIVQGGPRRLRWRTRSADLADRFRMIYGGGGAPSMGNLVLVSMRVSVRDIQYVPFPLVPGQLLRGGLLVRCEIAGNPVAVVGAQLSTAAQHREKQAAQLAAVLSDVDVPLILGADVAGADVEDAQAAQLLSAGRTVVGSAGRATIIVDEATQIDDCQVIDTPAARRASVHLPMVADLRLSVRTVTNA